MDDRYFQIVDRCLLDWDVMQLFPGAPQDEPTWVVFDVILVPRCTITFCTGAVFFICCFFTSPFAGWRWTLRKSDWSKVNIGERRAGNPIVSPSCVLSACMTGCGNDTVIIRLERQEDKSSRERMDM